MPLFAPVDVPVDPPNGVVWLRGQRARAEYGWREAARREDPWGPDPPGRLTISGGAMSWPRHHPSKKARTLQGRT